MKYNILICDDEADIVSALEIYLSTENYNIFKASNGGEALDIVSKNEIHLLILDIMMPVKNGIDTLRELRRTSNIPVIMLTAKSEDADKILGLDIGADDYIIKPFDSKELVARVKAVLRRYKPVVSSPESHPDKRVEYPDLIINQTNYSVSYMGKTVEMPPKELELLYFLASSPNHVFTREQLLDQIWGYEYIGDTRTVDVHIKRLREKIKDHASWKISTIWGIGYKFEVKGNPS